MEETRVISWHVARRVDASVDLAATTLDHVGEERSPTGSLARRRA
jgi:hypothetical protein